MSEPRTKTESQASVRDFIRGACEVVHSEDPGALCVVGPRPYYKLWELTEDVLQPTGSNTLYTFDFFVPKTFVMSDTEKESKRDCAQGENCEGAMFPALYPCREVYETWWHGKPGCQDGDSMVDVNARWIKEILQKYAFDFGRKHGVPVYCNQWGVKDEVLEANGRLRYAEAVLDAFTDLGIASTYWIWRSYTKGGRDVHEPVWGFELAHNDGPHEALDGAMLTTLQAGFLRTGRKYPASLDPCGAQLASVNASFAVTPLNASILAKRISLAQPTSLRFAPTPLPHSGVQCDVDLLERRIDWGILRQPPNASARAVPWPSPPPPKGRIPKASARLPRVDYENSTVRSGNNSLPTLLLNASRESGAIGREHRTSRHLGEIVQFLGVLVCIVIGVACACANFIKCIWDKVAVVATDVPTLEHDSDACGATTLGNPKEQESNESYLRWDKRHYFFLKQGTRRLIRRAFGATDKPRRQYRKVGNTSRFTNRSDCESEGVPNCS